MSKKLSVPVKLEKHCPKWYQYLKNPDYSHENSLRLRHLGEGLDIASLRYCLVGEKHGLMDLPDDGDAWNMLGCKECGSLAMDLCDGSVTKFSNTLKRFVKHCEEAHPVQKDKKEVIVANG